MLVTRRHARAIEAAWAAFAVGATKPVMIAKKAPFTGSFSSAAGLEDAAAIGESFDAVLWRVDRPLHEGLCALRQLLLPGAKVLFVVELVPGPWARAKELFGRGKTLRFSKEEACEALVLAGLEAPRVWLDSPQLVVLSANLPSALESLDQVFAQPLSA